MRVLILGGNGMVGHRLWMSVRDRHETWATIRGAMGHENWTSLFDRARTIEGVQADAESIDHALEMSRPDIVINAIGLVKQRSEGTEPGPAFLANCFVPHFLRLRCDASGARLIHLSTDCVFTGSRGRYVESDQPDSTDVYGLSKFLGEVGPPHLTIRTSVIGRSLSGSTGLLEWVLSQRGRVAGYRRAVFSGLASDYLADTIVRVIDHHANLSGVWHVASLPIDKFDLLVLLQRAMSLRIDVVPVDDPVIDRSLDDARFRLETGIPRPTWDEMVDQLAADPTPYEWLRSPASKAPTVRQPMRSRGAPQS